jgi:hypothetical protein
MDFFPNFPKDLYPLVFALILLGLVLAFVPRRRIRELFPAAFVVGASLSALFNLLRAVIHIAEYKHIWPFAILPGVSFFIAMSWPCAVLLYLHFRPRRTRGAILFLAAMVLAGISLEIVFKSAGILEVYSGWSLPMRAVFNVIWFEGAYQLHERFMKGQLD